MDIDFSSLDFQEISEGIEKASVKLPNGYTVFISRGLKVAHTYGAPYEVIMDPIRNEIMEESIGYLSEKEVKQIINEVSNLPKLKNSWKNSSKHCKPRKSYSNIFFPAWDW